MPTDKKAGQETAIFDNRLTLLDKDSDVLLLVLLNIIFNRF